MKISPANAYVTLNLYHKDEETNKRYTYNARYGTEPGTTITSLTGDYAGWKHYEINFDEVLAATSGITISEKDPSTSPSSFGIGLQHANSETTYLDNLCITNNA